ncbi:hypothetical protein [Aestuariibaculum sediminum]|uniref:Uncharacterized protein n=1 Tax=Aestuariibaculum sediminum TaxID=2770637 RepID=A0A8J6Q268_9FLAO|nr:hypothetical protein [Aestuariibaculum sediminum]MBD0831610.1 hypothetical protein [Aestuariibaculum sediminum]
MKKVVKSILTFVFRSWSSASWSSYSLTASSKPNTFSRTISIMLSWSLKDKSSGICSGFGSAASTLMLSRYYPISVHRNFVKTLFLILLNTVQS